MSIYYRTYGPINKYTTMFEFAEPGSPDYVGEDDTKFAKSFVRYDVPRSMQYPGRFDDEKWYSVNMQHAARDKRRAKTEQMELNRLRNIQKSANREQGLPRKKKIKLATPSWTTKAMRDEIKRLKIIVKKLNKVYGKRKYSLDHVIPLRGDLVSGLHIPENVQIMKRSDNVAKGNNYEVV